MAWGARPVRAFVVHGPGAAAVEEVDPPVAAAGEVVVDVERVGICGTDVEIFTGEMSYLHDGHARWPMRIGHEWTGTVRAVGADVDPAWRGRRVAGDTMLGCRRCARCRTGRAHVCADRTEVGIRGGRPGALAEQVAVPASSLHALPPGVDTVAGALVEPGGNAVRAARAADVGPGERALVAGPGTIGLLTALFLRAAGVEVHLLGPGDDALGLARTLGLAAWTAADLPDLAFDAVVDATNDPEMPARAVALVEPGRRVVWIGLAGRPSPVDSRAVVLADLTVVGVLSGSAGLAGAIAAYASGAVDPRPLVGGTVGLEGVAAVLAGQRPPGAGPGPKIHVDPRRREGD